MIPRLSRDRLPDLQGRSARFFANWLRNGVPSFLDGTGRDAFPGAANYVGWGGAIEEDLAAIYGVLAPAEQAAFEEGVATAAAELPLDAQGNGGALLALLRLAGLVHARETVDVIVAVLNGALIARVAEIDEVFERAFDLVVELASPMPRAVETLHMLITSVGFREAMAAPALVALARADPTRLSWHLDALAIPLNRQYHPNVLDQPECRTTLDRDRLLETVADLVPVAAVASAFGIARRVAMASDWILQDWFSRGVSTSSAPRVAALWRDVQDWIVRSGALPERRSFEYEPEPDDTDEFAEALGELPELVA